MDLPGVQRGRAAPVSLTRSRPSSSIPSAVPRPPSQVTSRPARASRARQASRSRSAGCASRRSSEARTAASTAGTSSGVRPSVPARSRSSGGKSSGRRATLMPMPEDRPALPRPRLGEDAGDLAPVDQDVVGPLDRRGGADRVGDRDARCHREQRRDLAQHERHREREPRRRRPRPALAPASGDLVVGRHERAVRRAGGRELARAVARGADRAQVQVGRAQRHAMRISSSSRRFSSSRAEPPLTASASAPEESS